MDLKDYLDLGVIVVLFIIWLVRLEGKQQAMKDNLETKIKNAVNLATEAQKDVDDLRVRHEGLDTKIVEQLSAVRESLARLEGRLGTIIEK